MNNPLRTIFGLIHAVIRTIWKISGKRKAEKQGELFPPEKVVPEPKKKRRWWKKRDCERD